MEELKTIQEVGQSFNKELQNVNKSVDDLLKFFQNEKKEQLLEKEQLKKEKKELEKQQQELQLIRDNQLQEKEQKEEKEQQQFYSNIETISKNTDAQTSTQLLQDVSTLMQVNVMAIGLLIGIVCISLFAKFFKKV